MAQQVVLRINGKPVFNTFKDLSVATRKLEGELRKLTPGTEAFIKKAEEVKNARAHFEKVKSEINAVRQATEKGTDVISRLTRGFLNFGEVTRNVLSGLSISGLVGWIKGNIGATLSGLLDLADQMSAVEKTTGLAKKQVQELWDSFDAIDTRTSKMELMKIAELAGRLGIQGKEDVAQFTQEIDKAYVALGDSFSGGLEAVATKLGKLKNLYDDTKEKSYAEAINQVGSALNELGANGTASEENISDFALRVGQLPDSLKPSVSAVLGLGAAFEESGVDAQIAASGYSRFITTAAENIDLFAHSMHMSVEEAQSLINTKPEEFFLRFAEGMKGLEGTEAAAVLESLKLNSLEVQKAVGSTSGSVDRFRESMELSAKSMTEATSLQEEFNKVNNNAAATWQKIKNAFSEFFSSGEIFNYFEGIIQLIGAFVGVTDDAEKKGENLRNALSLLVKTIKIAIVAWGSYNIATKASILLSKLSIQTTKAETKALSEQNTIVKILKASSLLLIAVKAKLTGNIKKATVAMRAFNMVTKANPLGLLISLVTTAATAFLLFKNSADEAAEKQKKLNAEQEVAAEYNKEVTKSTAELKNQIDPLIALLNDENISLELRRKAYEKLIEIAPEFTGTVDDEFRATSDLIGVYDDLIDKLDQVARAKAMQKVKERRAEELAELQAQEFEQAQRAKAEEIENQKKEEKNRKAIAEYKKNQELLSKNGGYDKFDFGGPNPLKTEDLKFDEQNKLKKIQDQVKTSAQSDEAFKQYWEGQLIQKKKELELLKKNGAAQKEIRKKESEIAMLAGLSPQSNSVKVKANQAVTPTPKPKPNRVGRDRAAEKFANEIKREGEAALKAEEQIAKALQKAEDDAWDLKHETAEEGMEKELQLLDKQKERKLRRLKEEATELGQKKNEFEEKIAELNAQKAKASGTQKEAINKSIAHYQKAIEQLENIAATHGEREKAIAETAEQKKLKVREQYLKKAIDQEKKAFENKQKDAYLAFEKELQSLDLTEKQKAKKRREFNQKQLEEQTEFLNQLAEKLKEGLQTGDWKGLLPDDLILSEEAKNDLINRLRELGLEANEVALIMAKMKGEDEKFQGVGFIQNADVLGMNAESWEQMFQNLDSWKGKLEMMVGVTQAMQQTWAKFHDFQMKKEQEALRKFEANANRKKDALKKQLDEGYINQKEYDAKVKAIEESVNKRRAEMEYKQAKYEKQNAIITSIINTALGVTSALGAKPWTPANFALAAVVGALGAAQTAMIASQPLPPKQGYAKGGATIGLGFKDETGHEVAGVVHADEYVIPSWMRKQPEVAKVEQWLEAKRTGKDKPYAEGGVVQKTNAVEFGTENLKQNEFYQLLLGALIRNSEVLEDIEKNGVKSYIVADEKAAKIMMEAQKRYESMKNKNIQ
ncbi:hypothetical protein ACT4RS_07485 [Ornithobacterium rhinotracheale]|uniref:hypothetical protein n=1 Tax=Ornithobacterium rhinotracheale TaxID=28251 RepID=UPI004035DD59